MSNSSIHSVSSWEDICFPVYSKATIEVLGDAYDINTFRSQAIIVEPPAYVNNGGEMVTPKPLITALQGPDYEVVPNSLIRDVAHRVLSKAGLRHTVHGSMIGYGDFRYQLVIEGKELAIGNKDDIIQAAINLSNNYTATGNLLVSGRTVEEKSTHYAEKYESIPAFSVYRKICSNGLWGWRDVSELEYLSALGKGDKGKISSYKKMAGSRRIHSPSELVEGEELQTRKEQTILAETTQRIRHSKGAVQYTDNLLEEMFTTIVKQYEHFAQSPVIRIYQDLYERKVDNFATRINEVIAATSRAVIPKNLLAIANERVVKEMQELGEPVANDWLVYNAFNYAIWNSDAKQHLNRRETAESAVLRFLLK